MNELNYLIKIHDIFEYNTPNNFPEIQDEILRLEEEKDKQKKSIFLKHFKIRTAAAVLMFIMLAGSMTVAAYQMTGADFFHMFYSEKAPKDMSGQVFLGLDQYKDISSSTVGTVVDTDEITIEVMGIIATGKVANVMLKITANQLESITNEEGADPLKHYRFINDTCGSLFEAFDQTITRYYFAEEHNELKPNQCELLYTIFGEETLPGKQYTIDLSQFGYFSGDCVFVPVYDKNYSFQVNLDMKTDYTRTVTIQQINTMEDYPVTINQFNLTPFSCIIDMQADASDNTAVTETMGVLNEKLSDLKITFQDGTVLDQEYFTQSTMGGREKEGIESEDTGYYKAIIIFNKPVMVDHIQSITVNGEVYDIS